MLEEVRDAEAEEEVDVDGLKLELGLEIDDNEPFFVTVDVNVGK